MTGRRGGGRGAAIGTAALGLLLLGCAVLFDAEPLYVPGLALLALVGGALAWTALGLRGARVEREVSARRVLEGEPVASFVHVRLRLPALPGTAVVDPLLGGPAPVPAGWRSARLRAVSAFERRGRRLLPAPALELRDPLRLLDARVAAPADGEGVLVLPRVEPVVAGDGTGDGGVAGSRRAAAGAAEVELDGLRPHREGAPASRIHWPAFARGAGLLERRLLPEADSRPLVVLDARGPYADADLDAAVRAVASLGVHLAGEGGCAVLLPGDRRASSLDASLHGWPALHARLALLEGPGVPPAAALAGRRGPLLWVTARRDGRVPRVLAQSPSVTRTLVVPGGLPGRRPAFTVAGCGGHVLGAGELRTAAERAGAAG